MQPKKESSKENRMKKYTLGNFMKKMRDPQQRKYFYALFGGKLLGRNRRMCFLVMMKLFPFI